MIVSNLLQGESSATESSQASSIRCVKCRTESLYTQCMHA